MTSFWVTFPCIIIGMILLILPTTFLLQWVCRLLIWVFLGPWYRIYCELFYKQASSLYMQSDCEDDRKHHKVVVLGGVTKEFEEKERLARIKGEEAAKLKAMRVMRNGKYVSRIPARNHTRHYDHPEALESHATMMALDKDQELPPLNFENRKFVSPQRLEGKMIPMTIEQSENEILQEKVETSLDCEFERTDVLDVCSRSKIEGSSSSISSITETAATDKTENEIKRSSPPQDVFDCRKSDDYEDSDLLFDRDDVIASTFSVQVKEKKISAAQVSPTSFDEEGLEIIDFALSQGCTHYEQDSLDSDDEIDGKSLSNIYKSSDTVSVAFFRN